MIPTQQQLHDNLEEFLRKLRYLEGSVYVGIHPLAQKAILHYVDEAIIDVVDYAQTYEKHAREIRDNSQVYKYVKRKYNMKDDHGNQQEGNEGDGDPQGAGQHRLSGNPDTPIVGDFEDIQDIGRKGWQKDA